MRVDAVLTEQGAEPYDLFGELGVQTTGVRPAPLLTGYRRRLAERPTTRLRLLATDEPDDLLAYPVRVGAVLHQHLRGYAVALTDEAEQDVLGADVVVAELRRLGHVRSSTFLARGVNGMDPGGSCWPRPIISSTSCRTASRLIPSDSSALAPTPSPSRMRPSRMCSVPT